MLSLTSILTVNRTSSLMYIGYLLPVTSEVSGWSPSGWWTGVSGCWGAGTGGPHPAGSAPGRTPERTPMSPDGSVAAPYNWSAITHIVSNAPSCSVMHSKRFNTNPNQSASGVSSSDAHSRITGDVMTGWCFQDWSTSGEWLIRVLLLSSLALSPLIFALPSPPRILPSLCLPASDVPYILRCWVWHPEHPEDVA